MSVKCSQYPNYGVAIDPRTITSARMPESLCVYKGKIEYVFRFLYRHNYCEYNDIYVQKESIYQLAPLNITNKKIASSHLFWTEKYLIEFLKTSEHN